MIFHSQYRTNRANTTSNSVDCEYSQVTRTIGIRAILISAILVSMVWANPVPQVSACVCDVDGPRQSLATYSKAVVGRSVARADAEVIFDVSYSYGVEVPEMIVISRSMCDGDFGDSTGFVLQISDEDWDRVICSSTPGLTMDSLAEDIGLERFEPLPLEHALRLGDSTGSDQITRWSLRLEHSVLEKFKGRRLAHRNSDSRDHRCIFRSSSSLAQ
jgi:hypothetical protein